MTSFQGQSIERRFSGNKEYNKNRRKKYIPVHPTAPHPDTNECIFPIVTGTPVTTRKENTSYIKLEDPVCADYHVLGDLWKGTMRLNDKDLNRLRVLAKALAPLDIRRQLKQAHKKDKGPVIIKQPVVASIPRPIVAPALPNASPQTPKPRILRPPENASKPSNLYGQQSYVPPKVPTGPSIKYIPPSPLPASEHKQLIPPQSSQPSHAQYGTIGRIRQPSHFPRDIESQRYTTSCDHAVHKKSFLLTVVEGFTGCIFSVVSVLLKFIW